MMADTLTPVKRRGKLTDADRAIAKAAFLEAYAKTGIVRPAAEIAGVSRQTVYEWQEHDEAFTIGFNQARQAADDAIRAEIHRRAIEGIDKPVYQGGRMVGTIREYSDTLLIFQAKARMPEYRDKQQIEHTGELAISLKALAGIRERARN